MFEHPHADSSLQCQGELSSVYASGSPASRYCFICIGRVRGIVDSSRSEIWGNTPLFSRVNHLAEVSILAQYTIIGPKNFPWSPSRGNGLSSSMPARAISCDRNLFSVHVTETFLPEAMSYNKLKDI